MQSVSITISVTSSNPVRCTLCDSLSATYGRFGGFLHQDITEILLKVALNTITQLFKVGSIYMKTIVSGCSPMDFYLVFSTIT